MAIVIAAVSLILSLTLAATATRLPDRRLRPVAALGAVVVLALGLVISSVRHVSADEVGIVVKNIGTKRLEGGAYIATRGEQGVQADVLEPGWHFGYWPFVFDVREVPLTDVPTGKIAILEAKDGRPLPPGQVIAPELPPEEFQRLVLDARSYLQSPHGYRGTQANVLVAGKYRLNTALFGVKLADVTEVAAGEVGVLKANFGKEPSSVVPGVAGVLEASSADPARATDADRLRLAGENEMGVRAKALTPGKYPINTDAFSVTEVWTTQMTAHFTAMGASNPVSSPRGGSEPALAAQDEREITVRTSDGFTFPVDVRVGYVIEPQNAPVVVAKLGDDEGERFRNALNSAVRAIFRNNAENVRALDYVQQRSHQEKQSLDMLRAQMARFGVTVTNVGIGSVGDERTLGALLKTQTDREIAKQELMTTIEQQKAAEQKKALSKTTQEAEEEKRLATAAYGAKIAEESRKQRVTEASGEAEAIQIRARAQAEAYRQIAEQVGRTNAALIEVLKIVGERNIQIAPRVMVAGSGPSSSPGGVGGAGVALIGTMLESMVSREPDGPEAPRATPPSSAATLTPARP